MCIDRSCYDGNCDQCRKIDRLCGWSCGYVPVKKKEITQDNQNKLNEILRLQIKNTEEFGRRFYKGIKYDSNELGKENRKYL